MHKSKLAFGFIGSLLSLVVGVNLLLRFIDLPDYGTWTGIRPLEYKLEQMQDLNADRPVDGIILGSSIADYGFSAETFSEISSQLLDHQVMVYNFSTGAAEGTTMPSLYRLVRTVAMPKEIYLVIPFQSKRKGTFRKGSPDFTMAHAPIGNALKSRSMLSISKSLWQLPLIENGAALRDLIVYGEFKNLVLGHSDIYRISSHGDMVSYLFLRDQTVLPDTMKLRRQTLLARYGSESEKIVAEEFAKAWIAPADLSGFQELIRLAGMDDCIVYLVAHDTASSFFDKSPEYQRIRRNYFDQVAEFLNCRLIYPLELMKLLPFEVSDTVHINQYAARRIAALVAYLRYQKKIPEQIQYKNKKIEQPQIDKILSDDGSFNTFSAVLMRPANTHYRVLICTFIESLAVPEFPNNSLFFGLRLPDNSDVIVPATKIGRNTFAANFDLMPSVNEQIFILRLLYGTADDNKVALNAPLADYKWVKKLPENLLSSVDTMK